MTTAEPRASGLEHAALAQLHREDEAIGLRTDWSLIFHAILIEAFLSAGSHSSNGSLLYTSPVLPIAAFGTGAAWLWFWTGMRQYWNLRSIVRDVHDVTNPTDPGVL